MKTVGIRLPADRENLNKLIGFIIGFAKENGFDKQRIWELELVADEIFSNIIDHAYPQQKGNIEVYCCFDDNKGLLMKINDHGIPFNPLSYPDPEISPDIEKISTKGFGIFLIRRLMDSIEYKREESKNCLILEKNHASF